MQQTKANLFPDWAEVLSLFWVVLGFNNLIAITAFTYQIGSLRIRFTALGVIGVMTYVLAAALLESLTVMVGLALLSVALPQKWFRQRFAHFGVLWYFMITLFLFPVIGFTSYRSMNEFFSPLLALTADQRTFFIGVWIVTIPALFFLFRRIIIRNDQKIADFLDRLSVLSFIYLIADCLALISIPVRLVLS